MARDMLHGAYQFPPTVGDTTRSTNEAMDQAMQMLQARKDVWVRLTIRERVAILDQLSKDFAAIAPRWVAASIQAKGITPDSPVISEEWGAGVLPVMRNLRLLRKSLLDIEACGHPVIPGRVTMRPNGQVVARVMPFSPYDRLFYTGVTADIWMEPGVTIEQLPRAQALAYQDRQHAGRVALVLGAGNVSSIAPMDILYKLFVEDQVVMLKPNPVNAYLGPLIEESFRALIEPGYLQIAYGGTVEGAYLCNHPLVEEIHITGSDKTFDAIVFGPGSEGAARKAARQPLLAKRVTGELGNVSPVIVVPGPWNASDINYQAQHIVSMLTNNAGFNCNATRVIIQQADWPQREQLMQQMRQLFSRLPPRTAYYPGAQERHALFIKDHPDAEQFGDARDNQLPWTFISGVDARNVNEVCFTTEAFCSLCAETTLTASDPADFIEQAVAFANDKLWGTLNVTLLVHPASLRDVATATAVERAIANLRYGTVAINYWAGISYALGVTTWGAFPGHELFDIQSGNGTVHNTLMFSQPQKSVLRAPFRSLPIPPWFVTQGKVAKRVFPELVNFEAAPSPWKVPGLAWSTLIG